MTVVKVSRCAIVIFGKPFNIDSMILRDLYYDSNLNVFFGYSGKEMVFIPRSLIVIYNKIIFNGMKK